MPLRLRTIYRNVQWLYEVCEDADTGEPILEAVVPGVGWYTLYFALTTQQAQWASTDVGALTQLVREMTADKGRRRFKDRLINPAERGGVVKIDDASGG